MCSTRRTQHSTLALCTLSPPFHTAHTAQHTRTMHPVPSFSHGAHSTAHSHYAPCLLPFTAVYLSPLLSSVRPLLVARRNFCYNCCGIKIAVMLYNSCFRSCVKVSTQHVLILYSLYCTHTVLTLLYSYCTHTVLILYSYCTHTVLTILYSYCTHFTVLLRQGSHTTCSTVDTFLSHSQTHLLVPPSSHTAAFLARLSPLSPHSPLTHNPPYPALSRPPPPSPVFQRLRIRQ
jgi:hypothetical protein